MGSTRLFLTRWKTVALMVFLALGVSIWVTYSLIPAQDFSHVHEKMKTVEKVLPEWIKSTGNLDKVAPLVKKLAEQKKAGNIREIEKVLDQILEIVKEKKAKPSGSFQVRAKVYDSRGKPVPKSELKPKIAFAGVYPLDTDYNPVQADITVEKNGEVIIEGPLPSPLMFHFVPRVKGFGQVKVYADNGGKGYKPPASGVWEIDLPLKATESRVAKTQALVNSHPVRVFRKETLDRLSSAKQYLAKATKGKRVDAGKVYKALNDSLWAGEMATLDVARDIIAKRGRRDGFMFGIFNEGHERWGALQKQQLLAVFNSVTVLDFFLASYELVQGKIRPEAAKRNIAMLEKLGFEVIKGHPLIFLIPPNIPPWLQGKEYEAVVKAMRTRVIREVKRFKGHIKIWDVINEAHMPHTSYSLEQNVELSRMALKWTKQADPAAIRVVNIAWPTGDYVMMPQLKNKAEMVTPYKYLKALQKARADYDVIGIQIYYPGLDMMEISRLLDRYAKLGKPIHITEVGVASAPGVDKKSKHFQDPDFLEALGVWHRPWDETTQADWIEQFYTIAYSKPEVEAITWVHFYDYFWPFGGLLHRDLTPKKSYWRLKQLLESWGFHGSTRVDSQD